MLSAIFGSFSLVALSEIGDKTQLLAFSLAARYRAPAPILAGILVATLLNHALASTFGQWIATSVSPEILKWALGVTFIAFGIWTLKPDELDEVKAPPRFGPFLTTTVLFFLAEMGDKTQLATVALAAKYGSAVLVTIGTTLGMMVTDGVAVFLGEKIAHKVQMRWIRMTAATLFFVFGLVVILDRGTVLP